MEKIYSVNMLIALFTDFREDGFCTLSESEVLEALKSLNAAQHRLQADGGNAVPVQQSSQQQASA